MTKRLIFLLIVVVAFIATTRATVFTDVTDIAYSDRADRCRLDIHHPTDTTGLPVIVWFHGGGLTSGAKEIPAELRNAGFVIVAPNYRLIPNVNVEDCIDDAAAAVAWTVDNISRYGGDPRRITVAGHSAGGYLTSMIGLDHTRLARYGHTPDSLTALVPFSGQVITHFANRRSKGLSELQPTIDETAPLFHVRPDAPPYIIITGDAERELFGRYEENLYMWRMMKLVGHHNVEIYKLDGFDHGSMCHPAFSILIDTVKRLTSIH